MARIGFFYLPWTGHINPLASLGRELMQRGHEVLFFQLPEFRSQAEERGLTFRAYGEGRFPPGAITTMAREMSHLWGEEATAASLEITRVLGQALLEEAPERVAEAKLDLWVVDMLEYAGATLATAMKAPFVTVIPTMLRHPEEGIPGFNGERYQLDDPAQVERERELEARMQRLARPYHQELNAYRKREGLPPFSYQTIWSPLAQISQLPPAFEFPRENLPDCLHFTGPFVSPEQRPEIAFPWDKLDERPLVYVSFGTAQNRNSSLFTAVLGAVAELSVQVVVSLGGADLEQLGQLPENCLAVQYAPQLEVLERASVMVHNGGTNSSLECLAAGVPMVAVPIAHDNHGTAARIAWTGTGVSIPFEQCNVDSMKEALREVLSQDSYRRAAEGFKASIARDRGIQVAADIVEEVLRTGKPVIRSRGER